MPFNWRFPATVPAPVTVIWSFVLDTSYCCSSCCCCCCKFEQTATAKGFNTCANCLPSGVYILLFCYVFFPFWCQKTKKNIVTLCVQWLPLVRFDPMLTTPVTLTAHYITHTHTHTHAIVVLSYNLQFNYLSNTKTHSVSAVSPPPPPSTTPTRNTLSYPLHVTAIR